MKTVRIITNGSFQHIHSKSRKEWEELLKDGCLVVGKFGKNTFEMDFVKVVVQFVLTPIM